MVNPERRSRIAVAAIAAIVAVAAIALVLMPHDVSVTYEGNGDVDPDRGSIRFYETLEITMTPDDGWRIGSVTVDGDEVSVDGNVLGYSVGLLDFSHHEVHVTFVEQEPTPEPDTHTVTITHTSGGDVTGTPSRSPSTPTPGTGSPSCCLTGPVWRPGSRSTRSATSPATTRSVPCSPVLEEVATLTL